MEGRRWLLDEDVLRLVEDSDAENDDDTAMVAMVMKEE